MREDRGAGPDPMLTTLLGVLLIAILCVAAFRP